MIKKITATAVLAMLCLNFWVKAQEPILKTEPLKVGDKLPASFWLQEHSIYQNEKITKQTLAQYKGKLLILDFWASWCSSCLKKWPMLDSMQQLYARQFNVLLVNEMRNGDDLAKIKMKIDASTKQKQGTRMASIYADSLLSNNFPHHLLPHYIWISDQGTVLAITGTDFANAEFIERLLNERLIRKKQRQKFNQTK